MNYNNIPIDEVKSYEKRQALLKIVVTRLKTIEKLIKELERAKKSKENEKKVEIAKYENIEKQYQQEEIDDIEFMRKGKEHNHNLNYIDLKILSLDMELASKRSLSRRLFNLGWILKIPYGLEEKKFESPRNEEEKIFTKKEIYNDFFKNVVEAEQTRIAKEQSFTILKRDFNNTKKSAYIVPPNHEFYGADKDLEERIYYLKGRKTAIQNYKSQNTGNYADFIDYSSLTIGDFTSENTEILFDRIFLENEGKRKVV